MHHPLVLFSSSIVDGRPFTPEMWTAGGRSRRQLRNAVLAGRVRPLLRGIYVDASRSVDLPLQVEAVSLVVPPGGVVVDRTAAWLHGLDLLRRSSVYEAPPVEIYVNDGTRMRRPGVDSGRRGLEAHDLMDIGGLRVTTPLRTSLDLARLLWRYDALGAIDQYLAAGVPRDEMLSELARFRGYRWVTQARALIPLGDHRSESMPESALRLHWYDALSVAPVPQWWVRDDDGHDVYRLDLADPRMRYAAEFDGQEFHTSTADRRHDEERRQWLGEREWEVDVLTRKHVYGFSPHPVDVLRIGYDRARARHGVGARVDTRWPW